MAIYYGDANFGFSEGDILQIVTDSTSEVNGTITGNLTFTQPTTVNFGTLIVGDYPANSQANSMNVVSNQSWVVVASGLAPTVSGDATADAGKMTKHANGSDGYTGYIASIKLHNQLKLLATGGYTTPTTEAGVTQPENDNFLLTGTNQTLAKGITEGQALDGTSGETRAVTFQQKVVGSDPAPINGYGYHMLISYTATATGY